MKLTLLICMALPFAALAQSQKAAPKKATTTSSTTSAALTYESIVEMNNR